jgi:hypothetical protein
MSKFDGLRTRPIDVSTVFRTNNHAVFWSTLVSVNASNSAGDK